MSRLEPLLLLPLLLSSPFRRVKWTYKKISVISKKHIPAARDVLCLEPLLLAAVAITAAAAAAVTAVAAVAAIAVTTC